VEVSRVSESVLGDAVDGAISDVISDVIAAVSGTELTGSRRDPADPGLWMLVLPPPPPRRGRSLFARPWPFPLSWNRGPGCDHLEQGESLTKE
jgi:hypothetical protein